MQVADELKNVTVRQISQLDIFKKYARLVAGEKGLDRFVTHTTVWEAPDLADRLEGQEFVFSMGYVTKTQPARGLQGFSALTDVVSAMGFKVGYYLDEIPEEYISLANKKNVPLFVVKSNCLFKWLIQAIMAEINLYQASVLMEVDRYFQDLYETALNDGRDITLLTQLSERILSPCLLLSADLETALWAKYSLTQLNEQASLDELRDILREHSLTDNEIHTGPWHIVPLVAKGLCLGYLIIWDPKTLNDKRSFMIKQLRMLLTMKWLERFEGDERSLARLWHSLLTAPEEERQFIAETLLSHGIQPDEQIRLLVLRARSSQESSFRRKSRFLIANICRLFSKSLCIWNSSDECVILYNALEEKEPPFWLAKAEETMKTEAFATLIIAPSVSAGAIRDGYRIAQNCARIILGRDAPNLFHFRQFLYELSLLGGANTLETSLFLDQTLMPLVQYDSEHGNQNFIDTIKALVDVENLQEAAALLHVHTNTLRYRIQRIKDLTGLDLYHYRERSILAHGLFCHKFKQ